MSDDPKLRARDDDGIGRESIFHERPKENELITIGVDYFADAGLGPSYATVRIYSGEVLIAEVRDRYLESEGVFWEVGTIEWPSKRFLARDVTTQGFP